MSEDRESRITETLIERGLVTEDQIAECRAINEEMVNMGLRRKPLVEILLEKKYLSREDAARLDQLVPPDEGPRDIRGYEILGTIGKGAMGTVYKGFQKSMEREVAIKILAPEFARNESYIQRFVTEARMAAKVKHPNIVTGIDVGQVEGMYYLIMEYCPGRPVNEILYEGGRIPLDRVVDIGLQIADALKHAHLNDLVHRDVKPENILLDEEGTAKLCDMGLAKVVDRDAEGKSDKETVGTPLYISPEIVQGRDADIRSDIYSLGATLYHMILGRPPFFGTDAMAIMRSHVEVDVVPPAKRDSSVPPELSAVVMKMLAKNPDDRYSTPGPLIKDLRKVRELLRRRPSPEPVAPEPAAPAPEPESAREASGPGAVAMTAKTPSGGVPVASRKAKLRRSRSSSMITLYVVVGAAALAGVLILIGIFSSSGKNGGQRPRPPLDEPGTGPGDDGDTGPADDVNLAAEQADQKALEDAVRFLKDHPEARKEALDMFRKVAGRQPPTDASKEAASHVTRLQEELQKAEKAALEKAKKEVASVLVDGRGLERGVEILSDFLKDHPEASAGVIEEAKKEIASVEQVIRDMWGAEAQKVQEFVRQKDYAAAEDTLRQVAEGRSFAAPAAIRRLTGDDPHGMLEKLRADRRKFEEEVRRNAGDHYRGFVTDLLKTYREGLDPSTGKGLSPYARYGTAARNARKISADPLLGTFRKAAGAWVETAACAAHFLSGSIPGLSRWSGADRKVKLTDGSERTFLQMADKDGKRLVVLGGPSEALEVETFLDRLTHATLYALCLEGHGGVRMGPTEHRGAALFLVLSPCGSVADTAETVRMHLGRAGTALGPPAELAELLASHAPAKPPPPDPEPAILKAFEALKRESLGCRDKRSSERMLRKWKAFEAEHGESETFRKNESFVRSERARLDRLAHPPEPAAVPGLHQKAADFNPKTGKIEIAYDFKDPRALNDWMDRKFDWGPQADYINDTFLGKRIDAKTAGGTVQAKGGGFLFWKPRVVGDFSASMDLYMTGIQNQGLVVHMTDAGGYAFVNSLNLFSMASWLSDNNITLEASSGTGLFRMGFGWPPQVKGLKIAQQLYLAPKRWMTLHVERRGATLTVKIAVKGKKKEAEISVREGELNEGRIGIFLMKSGLVLDNFRFQGEFDLGWLGKAREKLPDDADLPGQNQ
jgi:serine/threonine-protein kinase